MRCATRSLHPENLVHFDQSIHQSAPWPPLRVLESTWESWRDLFPEIINYRFSIFCVQWFLNDKSKSGWKGSGKKDRKGGPGSWNPTSAYFFPQLSSRLATLKLDVQQTPFRYFLQLHWQAASSSMPTVVRIKALWSRRHWEIICFRSSIN